MASVAEIDGLTISSGAVTPPLDTYTGAAAAYSVRLLRTAYTGDIMRVRRALDNVEADVGFDGGELKLTSPISNTSDAQSYTDFADFVDHTGTPTDAFCRYWYDQSGNGIDAGQATSTSQPKVYDSSVPDFIKDNGKPIMRDPTTGSSQGGKFDTSISFTGDFTTFQVSHDDFPEHITFYGGATYWPYVGSGTGSPNVGSYTTAPSYWGNGSAMLTQRGLLFSLMQNQSLLVSQGAVTLSNVTIGASPTTYRFPAMQELLIWYTDQDTAGNRSGIEDNMNGFFQIY